MMKDARKGLADLLDRLANGESVELGDFSGQGTVEASDADIQAELLRGIAESLRTD